MSDSVPHQPSAGPRALIVGERAQQSGIAEYDQVLFLDWAEWVDACSADPNLNAEFVELDPERRRIEQLALEWASAIAPVAVDAVGLRGPYGTRTALVTRRLLQHGACYAAARAAVTAEVLVERVRGASQVELLGVDSLTGAFIAEEARLEGVEVTGAPEREQASPGLLPGVRRPLLRAVASALRSASRASARSSAEQMARNAASSKGRSVMFVSQAPRDEAIAGDSVRRLRERGAAVVKVDLSRDGRMLSSGFAADAVVDGRLWMHAYPLGAMAPYLLARRRAIAETIQALPEQARPVATWLAPLAVALAGVTAPGLMRATGRLLDDLAPERVVLLGETNRLVEPLAHEARAREIPVTCVQHGIIHDIPQWSEMPFSTFAVYGEAYAEVLASLGTPAEHIAVTGDPRLDRAKGREPRGRDEVLSALGSIPDDARVVLFAANYTSHRLSGSSMERAFRALVQGIAGLGNVTLVVKLHPQGAGRELPYERVIAENPDAPVLVAPRDSNLVDLISVADVVAVHVSSVGFEAAAMDTPLLVVNPDEGPQEVPFVREGIGHEARNAEEVADLLGKLLRGELGVASAETIERFNRRYNHLLDGHATERLAEAIDASAW